MNNQVTKLKANLDEQINEYKKIEDIENTKSDYILTQDGEKIQELSEKQEHVLKRISNLEFERTEIINAFIIQNHLKKLKEDLTLKEVIDLIDDESAQSIYEAGAGLKTVVMNIKMLNDKNSMLLNDNLEFYNILMENMKDVNVKSEGYSSNGTHKTERGNGALIFNKTV